MKNLIIALLVFFALFIYSCNQSDTDIKTEVENSSIAKDVTVQEFKRLIDNREGTIIDVRTFNEFRKGGIKGAKNIDISSDFSNKILALDKNKPVYLYCASGGRSSRAMQIMSNMGFTEVYNLTGGYTSWSRQ